MPAHQEQVPKVVAAVILALMVLVAALEQLAPAVPVQPDQVPAALVQLDQALLAPVQPAVELAVPVQLDQEQLAPAPVGQAQWALALQVRVQWVPVQAPLVPAPELVLAQAPAALVQLDQELLAPVQLVAVPARALATSANQYLVKISKGVYICTLLFCKMNLNSFLAPALCTRHAIVHIVCILLYRKRNPMHLNSISRKTILS